MGDYLRMDNADDQLMQALLAQGFTCIETHLSRVYIRGEDVFKTKRNVRFSFVDFSTAEARRKACEAEVTLNRRLAPDVYEGVVVILCPPVGDARIVPPAALSPGEEGTWAVHMRRLDAASRGDTLLAEGRLGAPEIAAIAAMLSHFHAECRSDAETARFGAESVLRGNMEENFRELAGLLPRYLGAEEAAQLRGFQRDFLDKSQALLSRRVREGKVRDGHGDLRLEHLYRRADGGFFAIDCIEFNDRFRYADVALDLAFLAMDLHLHGRADLAELLLAVYARESFDYELYALVDFYVSYRAVVRAKVSAFLAADAAVTEEARVRGQREAERAFTLALRVAAPTRPRARLVVCSGQMASGKSTVARALGEHLSAPVVSADRIRKHLLHVDPLTPRHEAPFRGSYSEEVTDQTYTALRQHAELVLRSGRSVVLDATYRAREERSEVLALAGRLGVPVLFIECSVPREVSLERLKKRAECPSESDGRLEIFDAVALTYQATTEISPGCHLPLDTTRPLAENFQRCLARLGDP
jgi:aminoglycoside phosphotransferase family enzyme/predicted kinase